MTWPLRIRVVLMDYILRRCGLRLKEREHVPRAKARIFPRSKCPN
jgi:hypothetical protein